MIEKLEQIDKSLFLFINGLHSPFFDNIMRYVSTTVLWIPLFLVFFIYAYKKGKLPLLCIVFFGLAICVLLADRISVEAFKNVFLRYRPSHNLDLENSIHLLPELFNPENKTYKGGMFGFVSSHAANFFAITTFLVSVYRHFSRKWILLFLWAIIIGYSRIYLGVHYPADVVVGGIMGILIGFSVYQLSKIFIKKYGIIKN